MMNIGKRKILLTCGIDGAVLNNPWDSVRIFLLLDDEDDKKLFRLDKRQPEMPQSLLLF